ncbi:MAG: hypothetical protein JKY65_34260 [Planctomycetes bacterium]|nr:hypothetical protein [Planctomycetota bacterium]
MNTARQLLFGLVLGLTCAYHLGIGVVSLAAPDTTLQIAAMLYDVHASAIAPQVVYMLKALGMYALFTGCLLALALSNPAKYRHVVIVCAGLLIMRATTRLLFFDVLHDAFAVEWGRNLINVFLLVLQAGVLVSLCPTSEEEPEAAPSRSPARSLQPLLGEAREVFASASRRLAPIASNSGRIFPSGIR